MRFDKIHKNSLSKTEESDNSSLPTFGLLSLVLGSILATSVLVPQTIGYLITAVIFGLVCFWLILTEKLKVTGLKPALTLYIIVIMMFTLSVIRNPSLGGVARLAAFSCVTTVIVFSLVPLVNFIQFWRWYGIVTAAIVALGIPTLFVDQISLGLIVITAYHATIPGLGVNIVTSIFTSPNLFSLACSFAVVGLVTTQRLSRLTVILVVINGLGVTAGYGRSAQVATIAGLGIFIIGRWRPSAVFAVTTIAIGGIMTVLLMIAQIIPGPDVVATINLSGRKLLWSAAVDAIREQPFIGYGLGFSPDALVPYLTNSRYAGYGPHNTYLRVAVNGGIVAAISYLGLMLYVLFETSRRPVGDTLAALAVFWTTIIIQLFEDASIFGFSIGSVIFAITLGWCLREISPTEG